MFYNNLLLLLILRLILCSAEGGNSQDRAENEDIYRGKYDYTEYYYDEYEYNSKDNDAVDNQYDYEDSKDFSEYEAVEDEVDYEAIHAKVPFHKSKISYKEAIYLPSLYQPSGKQDKVTLQRNRLRDIFLAFRMICSGGLKYRQELCRYFV